MMFILIRNASIFAPAPLGIRDILVAAGKIVAIAQDIDVGSLPGEVETIDALGFPTVPGFIDAHVHAIGGGGEGGYSTRTPEIQLSTCIKAGVTTIVGTLGTDGVARGMESLVAKTYALREEGLSAWCYTGSYRVPPRTVTGDAMKDIMMIDPIIGIGEVAISDHRSSMPSIDELGRLASEARVAGMLSGKAGVINFHIGDAPGGLAPLEALVASGEMPRGQFIPTHCNRSARVFESALAWARRGGSVDLTTSTVPIFVEEGEISVTIALRRLLDSGIPLERITCTSDGQGSLPLFNDKGNFAGLGVGSPSSLWEALRQAILAGVLPLEDGLKPATSSPARALKFGAKGRIAVGADADVVILDPVDYRVRSVLAMGRPGLVDGVLRMQGRLEG